MPAVMTLDRGTQFTSSLWAALCSLLGIQHVQTTAYHPKGNGLDEWLHRHLKGTWLHWPGQVRPLAMGHARPLFCCLRGCRHLPSQAVFGSPVCLPGQLSLESELELDKFLKKQKATLSGTETVNSRFNTTANRIPAAVLLQLLLDTSQVLVHQDGHMPLLAPLYNNPYAVLWRSLRTFTILMGDRKEVVSTSRLKQCHTPNMVPVLPHRCGRLPGPAGQLGLPPRCPPGPTCTIPTQPHVNG